MLRLSTCFLLLHFYVPSFAIAQHSLEKASPRIDLLQDYQRSNALPIREGDKIPYPQESECHRSTYLENAYLEIDKVKDIDVAAQIISQGKNVNATKEKLLAAKNKGQKEISLTELIPQQIQNLSGKKATCDGPNCGNATLMWHYPDAKIDASAAAELDRKFESDFALLPKGSELKFGDVVAFYDPTWGTFGLSHSTIYLGGNLFWHKASQFQCDPWTFETFDNISKYYTSKGYIEKFSKPAMIQVFRKK